MVCESLKVALELTANKPRRVAPSQHRVAFSLCPLLVVGHHARQARRVEQRLVRYRYVYQGGAFGSSERVSQYISNDPGMFTREMVKGEALLFSGEFNEVARGLGKRVQHLGG